jgi:hypothetical protein
MSEHVQTQIFLQVITLLTGLSTTGDHIYVGSEHPETPDTMPGITVSVGDVRYLSGSLESTVKEFDLELGYYVPGDDHLVTTQISLEVSQALYGSGGVSGISFSGSSRKYKSDAAYKHTVVTDVYKVRYETADGDDSAVY